MQTDTYDDDIVPHDQFVAKMEQDKRARYIKGGIALLGVIAMVVFLMFAITQLAGGGGAVFAN